MTVEVTTKAVDSFFPYQMLWFLIFSPAQYESWAGTGTASPKSPPAPPFRLARLALQLRIPKGRLCG
jgi:peptide/nickel transport system substrate-binding protein